MPRSGSIREGETMAPESIGSIEQPHGESRPFDARGLPHAAAPLDTKSTSALHVQLADALREKIYNREWPVSSKIPSEHELMKQFGISRGTVRRALKSLVDEGLLVQEHGRGTFVAEPGISHAAGVRPISFAQSLREQGKSFVTRVIDKRVIPAPVDVANELGIHSTDAVLFMRRVRLVGDEPVMCQESWSNLVECPGLDTFDYVTESLFDAVESCSGRRIKLAEMRYQARVAGREHGELLGCDEAAAVLVLEQRIRLTDGTAIEWSNTWLKPGQSIVGTAVQPD